MSIASIVNELPDPTDPVAAATFMIEHAPVITEWRSWLARAQRTISTEVEQRGHVSTPAGRYGKVRDTGWEYPPIICDEFPGIFGIYEIEFTVDHPTDVERVLDLLLESMPDLGDRIRKDWRVTTKVDGRTVATFIKESLDHDTVTRLKLLRRPRTRLGVMR